MKRYKANSVKKVLIADDDYITTEMYKAVVEDLGHKVVAITHTGDDTVKKTIELHPDVVLLDIKMEDRNSGIDACKLIKNKFPKIKVYLLTAYAKEMFERELPDTRHDGFINKMKFIDIAEELLK